MTADISRPGEWRTIGDHDQRIRILEATVPDDPGNGGDSICCITPLDGLIISDCSAIATPDGGPYEGHFSVLTGGRYFNILDGLSPDYFENKDTCDGQTLFWRGYLENCTGMTPNVNFQANNVAGTHVTAYRPIQPSVGDPFVGSGSVLPWESIGVPSGSGVETQYDIRVVVDLGGIGAAGLREGDYWFEFAWFDDTSVQNPSLADSPVNPGIQAGQLARWNGIAWEPFPNGTAGQVLTMSGGFPTWV